MQGFLLFAVIIHYNVCTVYDLICLNILSPTPTKSQLHVFLNMLDKIVYTHAYLHTLHISIYSYPCTYGHMHINTYTYTYIHTHIFKTITFTIINNRKEKRGRGYMVR